MQLALPIATWELSVGIYMTVKGFKAPSVTENDKLRAVELNDGRMIERTAVFVRPRNTPHNDGLLAERGCERNDAGFAIVDTTGRTSSPHVSAAGNVVDQRT